MNSNKEIREQFKSKLNDFKYPIPDDGWERIEQSLSAGKLTGAISVKRIWQLVGTVAAVALLIVAGLLFIDNPSGQMETVVTEASQIIEKEKLSDSFTSEEAVSIDLQNEKLHQGYEHRQKSSRLQKRVSQGSNLLAEKLAGSIVEDKIEKIENLWVTDEKKVEDRIDEIANFNPSVNGSEKDNYADEFILITQDQDKLLAENSLRSDERRVILSVGGKGGLTSFHQTVNSPMTLRSATVNSEPQLHDESEKMMLNANRIMDNIAEMEHDQPVSFGITVSKTIIDDLYIETGLIYSYLYSRSKNTSTVSQNHQTQSLHYLGIPLNINYNLFSLRNLNVYASIGGMIEKDVYGKFREEGVAQSIDEDKKSEVLINEKISQRNPQLSVNAGLGLSYPLYRDLKLYGKIGGAYYFDANNEFKTIYSDRKIVMDLSLGIRYEF